MGMVRAHVLWLTLVLVSSATAECSRDDAIEAEAIASTLPTWSRVYSAFRLFHQCDDGAIGEGFSESVSRLLADRWEVMPELSKLSSEDNEFRRFVLRHLDETVPAQRWKIIVGHARHDCPTDALSLCKDILSRDADLEKADCGHSNSAKFAQQFFSMHRSFYFEETPALWSYVTPSLYRALQNHYRCAAAEGICHLDYDPWLGAQDGEIAGDPTFSAKSIGLGRSTVTMAYRFEIEPGRPTKPHRVVLHLKAAPPPVCWQVSDLVTPLGHSLAKRYSSRTP